MSVLISGIRPKRNEADNIDADDDFATYCWVHPASRLH